MSATAGGTSGRKKPLGPAAGPKTCRMAVASLILSILGPVGLVLGILARRKVKGSSGQLRGRGVATSAIVVSAIVIVLAGMLLPALGKARQEAKKTNSKNNLRTIAQANHLWVIKFGRNSCYPPSLKRLLDDDIINEPKVFLCPGSDSKLVPGKFVCDYESIFDLVKPQRSEDLEYSFGVGEVGSSTTPLAWEKRQFFSDGRCVVYFDSHVQFVPEGDVPRFLQQVERRIREMRGPFDD